MNKPLATSNAIRSLNSATLRLLTTDSVIRLKLKRIITYAHKLNSTTKVRLIGIVDESDLATDVTEQYTELLEPISEPHQNNVISAVSSVKQSGGTVEQHPATVKKTRKHDPPAVYDSEETLQLAQESRLKMKQLNKEIKQANYAKINQLSEVFVSQKAKSREELYFSNTSKTASVSKSISIPNEEFSDDTSPSVARKFLNEVKSTIVTLQRVVKQKMTLDIHNWSSSAHQELLKIVKDKIYPIVNQVDARVQNFEIEFLKEVAKFVQDFKSLANEADESLAKHKALEFEFERLLRAVVSQDILSIVKNNSVVDISNLQTDLDRTKEKLETCIIKKEKEYVVLWNNWYKKCEECKYDKISYDKAYNDMQQKIEQLQAQLRDLKAQLFDKVSEQKDTTKGTSANTKFVNQSTVGKPLLQPLRNHYVVRQPNEFQSERPKFSKTQVPPKVVEMNGLSNP
ncbi:hypothetical protein Tco_1313815, partial [Tanacetum coccineum]